MQIITSADRNTFPMTRSPRPPNPPCRVQAKLKAEYERMESKLAAMESRIQGKDSGDDSDSDTEPIEEPIRLLSKLSTAASRRPLSAHTRANGVSREWPRSKSGPP